MRSILKKKKLTVITAAYWFMLVFIVTAWIWWFISLQNLNSQMLAYKMSQLNKDDPAYTQQLFLANDEHDRKTAQFISEGVTFILVTLAGAVFVYRAVRKQIKLSHQQQNFMMAVTHELKTPIAITRLNLETLQKHKLDEAKQQKLLSVALNETDRLNTLTNNILVASQLESGNYTLNKQEINFSQLVTECIKEFQNHHPQRYILHKINENIFLEGETMLLQMMVNNLMENALRYSTAESRVTVSLLQNADKAVLSIADEGEGIAEEEKKMVFEKFYRIGNEATRKTKGTGLGLYLCKKIINDHKGLIILENNIPRGSTFTVTFQLI